IASRSSLRSVFADMAPTPLYPLSLHDALPIYLVELREVIDLDLALELRVGVPHALQRGDDAAGSGDVVVLDQRFVAQAIAVVHAATAGHGVLLQVAQARDGLAGVADPRARALDGVDPAAG